MKATMIATNRRYTKAEKLAYQQREHKRRITSAVLNGEFIANGVRFWIAPMRDFGEATRRAAEGLRQAGEEFKRAFPLPAPPVGPQLFDRLAEIAPDIMHQRELGGMKADHVFVDELATSRPKPGRTLEEILGLDLANEVPLDQQGRGPDGWVQR